VLPATDFFLGSLTAWLCYIQDNIPHTKLALLRYSAKSGAFLLWLAAAYGIELLIPPPCSITRCCPSGCPPVLPDLPSVGILAQIRSEHLALEGRQQLIVV